MRSIVTRVIWCEICNGGSPQKHIIDYKGTDTKDKKTMAKFDSECIRCKERAGLGIQTLEKPKQHLVPIVSYNALISREIYEGSFAV